MHLTLDHSSERPVYLQIIDHIKREIALGRLTKDQKLPTVRQLANQLVINPNTIAKAYKIMEQDGLIITRQGSGTYVAMLDSRLSFQVRHKVIVDQIERTVVDAVHLQIGQTELKQWFAEVIEKFNLRSDKDLTHE